ncbi:hypothetical protein VSX61_00930 [Brenneria populi subsp. brevivirga]|uniref:hypothetical protein n=1 Tax=Brenneria populi TaxID=1505588 RepID=UPI002E185D90|nr:hypothetical protein [Brenneria populi subsp. brevivirga]
MTTLSKQAAPKKFLIQLRAQDSEFGVSEETFNRMMKELSLSQTELVHKALRSLAETVLPAYEPDDGPLTDEQLETIRKLSPASHITLDNLGSPLLGDDE